MESRVLWVGMVDARLGALMLSRSWSSPAQRASRLATPAAAAEPGAAADVEDGRQNTTADMAIGTPIGAELEAPALGGPALGVALLERSRRAWVAAQAETQVLHFREDKAHAPVAMLVRSVDGVVFVVSGTGLFAELEMLELLELLIAVCKHLTDQRLSPDTLRTNSAKVATCLDEMVYQGHIDKTSLPAVLQQAKLRQ